MSASAVYLLAFLSQPTPDAATLEAAPEPPQQCPADLKSDLERGIAKGILWFEKEDGLARIVKKARDIRDAERRELAVTEQALAQLKPVVEFDVGEMSKSAKACEDASKSTQSLLSSCRKVKSCANAGDLEASVGQTADACGKTGKYLRDSTAFFAALRSDYEKKVVHRDELVESIQRWEQLISKLEATEKDGRTRKYLGLVVSALKTKTPKSREECESLQLAREYVSAVVVDVAALVACGKLVKVILPAISTELGPLAPVVEKAGCWACGKVVSTVVEYVKGLLGQPGTDCRAANFPATSDGGAPN